MEQLRWDDPALTVGSDSARTARYRLLQSRWRETVLGMGPGTSQSGDLVGSMLPADASKDLQWLTPIIALYVAQRLPEAHAQSAAVEEGRLYRNLLSSQPLCFNVFGHLAAFAEASARLLTQLLGRVTTSVDEVRVEHTPKAALALGDRSAFDCYLSMTSDRGREFIGVETKYTESFSSTAYERPSYITATDDETGWFVPGSASHLVGPATNQLWRTVLLAQLTEQASSELVGGVVVVLTADGDSGAKAAVSGVKECLKDPERVRHLLLEDLVDAGALEPDLQAWAALFAARYLAVDHH